jgi:hypothetical protein
MQTINRYSSHRNRLDHAFLSQRQKGARLYDRIAGYFNSFLFELVGEQLEGMSGKIRVICIPPKQPPSRSVMNFREARIGFGLYELGANTA